MEPRKSFLLRMNAALWREIETWAQEDFRSVNGQVEFLLREATRQRRRSRGAQATEQRPARAMETQAAQPEVSKRESMPQPARDASPESDLEVGRQD
jgi:hypothetical protein